VTRPTQLPFDLPYRTAFGRADFLVSDCNAAALGLIERWPDWPARILVLHGPAGCGKSHLAELWRRRSGAALLPGEELGGRDPSALAAVAGVAVDDAEQAPERALLHLYNCCAEAGASLLVVARAAPAAWSIALPDLGSRLRAAPAAAIALPDDALLAAVLVKHFADRQVRVPPAVIAYLVPRMERSFAAAAALADRLDRLALGAGGPITVKLARRALDGAADQSSSASDFGVT
jgi:chromosomal replication initiation ATPase DnaA